MLSRDLIRAEAGGELRVAAETSLAATSAAGRIELQGGSMNLLAGAELKTDGGVSLATTTGSLNLLHPQVIGYNNATAATFEATAALDLYMFLDLTVTDIGPLPGRPASARPVHRLGQRPRRHA